MEFKEITGGSSVTFTVKTKEDTVNEVDETLIPTLTKVEDDATKPVFEAVKLHTTANGAKTDEIKNSKCW